MKLVDLYGTSRITGRGVPPRPHLEPGHLERLVRLARQRAGGREHPAPAEAARARLLDKRLERQPGRSGGGER
jgi:hypothetical protein